jgi:hypothetical protein
MIKTQTQVIHSPLSNYCNLRLIGTVAAVLFVLKWVPTPTIPAPIPVILILAILSFVLIKYSWIFIVPISTLVLLINTNTYANNLGDKSWFIIASQEDDRLWASSIGSHWMMRTIVSSPNAVQLTMPILGVITFLILVMFAYRDSPELRRRQSLIAMAVIVGCLPIFTRGFLEMTPFGFPIAVSAMCFSGAFSLKQVSNLRVSIGAILAVLASFFHGVYLLVPLFLVIVAVTNRTKLRRTILFTTIASMMLGATIIVLINLLCRVQIIAGDATGGGDGQILPARLLSLEHLQQTLVLVFFGSALFLFQFLTTNSVQSKFLKLLGPGLFALFLFLWNFDLGWSRDLDLVIAASVVLIWTFSENSNSKPRNHKFADYFMISGMALCMALVIGQAEWIMI